MQDVVAPELVAELAAAIDARVLEMDHYVRPDGQMQSRHKGDHLHLCARPVCAV
jgi:hypothetical protein|eukprot:COSAG02_NODE_862_length_16418_cov_5.730621_11_plen_54_part_00